MEAAHCALVVALKFAPDDPEFVIARQHLEAAIALSSEYYKVCWSIFWKTSPERVKKRIRYWCNQLAFDTYSEMIDLADLVNEYAPLQNIYWYSTSENLGRIHSQFEMCFQVDRERASKRNLFQATKSLLRFHAEEVSCPLQQWLRQIS